MIAALLGDDTHPGQPFKSFCLPKIADNSQTVVTFSSGN
jgi:hypothetical protein